LSDYGAEFEEKGSGKKGWLMDIVGGGFGSFFDVDSD